MKRNDNGTVKLSGKKITINTGEPCEVCGEIHDNNGNPVKETNDARVERFLPLIFSKGSPAAAFGGRWMKKIHDEVEEHTPLNGGIQMVDYIEDILEDFDKTVLSKMTPENIRALCAELMVTNITQKVVAETFNSTGILAAIKAATASLKSAGVLSADGPVIHDPDQH